jgi:uncharacterized DUF497 family protein
VGCEEGQYQSAKTRRVIPDGCNEQRWHTIGMAGGIALLLVVHTIEEEHDEETIRIISAREASSRERALYDFNQ